MMKTIWKSINVKWCLFAHSVYCCLLTWASEHGQIPKPICLEVNIVLYFSISKLNTIFSILQWTQRACGNRSCVEGTERKMRIDSIQLKNNGTRFDQFDQIPHTILLSHYISSKTIGRVAHAEATQCCTAIVIMHITKEHNFSCRNIGANWIEVKIKAE